MTFGLKRLSVPEKISPIGERRRQMFGRGALFFVISLLFYLAISIAFFGRDVSWTKYYFGYSNDSLLFIWFLNWWPFAITHGLNPFICKFVWFPGGYNVTWATSLPSFAILMWPVTALGGPVLTYNIIAVTAPALAAWTGFLLIHEVTKNQAASLMCGFLFGFCEPELYQLGQLNLSSVFLVPLAVLLCLRHVQGRLGRRAFVVLLILLLAVQLGISTEILASMCLMGALAWAVFLVFTPTSERGALWRLAVGIAISAPLTLILTAPFIYYLGKGLPDVPAEIHPLWLQLVEALNFIIPVVPIHSGWAALASIGRQLRGFRPDYNTFVSSPVLFILVLYSYRHFGKPYIMALLTLIGLIALLSLGPILMLNGKVTGISLPWMMLSHIPVLSSIIPSRLTLFLTLAATIIVALWLAEAKTLVAGLPRYALAGLACLFLRPADVQVLTAPWQTHEMFKGLTTLYWSRWPDQPFFKPAHLQAALGKMPNVLLLPDPVLGPGTAWQINSGLSFTQSNGYVGFRPVPEQQWSTLGGFLIGMQPVTDFDTVFAAFCATHRVNYVLIGPGAPAAAVSAIEGLGWAHHLDDGIEVVKTPAATQ